MTRTGTIALCLGITAVAYLPNLIPLVYLVPALLLAALACRRWPYAWPVAGFLLGMLWATFFGMRLMANLLPLTEEGIALNAQGYVAGLPETGFVRGEPVQRFTFVAQSLCHPGGECLSQVGRLKLSWYGGEPVMPGDRMQLMVRLKRPHGMMNPGGFDYQSWLVSQRYIAQGYVRQGRANEVERAIPLAAQLDRWRFNAIGHLARALIGLENAGVVRALLLGDKRAIDADRRQLLIDTGTIHLAVISGLHIGLIAAVGYGLGLVFVGIFRRQAAVHRLPVLFAVVFAFVYSAAAGFSLPTQRALTMVLVVMLATALRRHVAMLDRLLLALLVCLVFDPLAVTTPSLWLSFGAVAILLYVSQFPGAGRLHRWLLPHLALLFGLLPLLAAALGQWSPLSLLANLVAVPLFSVMLVPLVFVAGSLEAVFGSAAGLWGVIDTTLALWFQHLHWLVSLTGNGALYLPPVQPLALGLAVVGVIWLLGPAVLPARALGVVCLLPLLLWRNTINVGEARVTVLDVGQGLSVVVKTRGHTLVYDVGPASDQFDTASAVVLPYLRRQGVRHLDALVISHGDNDHAGRWPVLAEKLDLQKMYVGEALEGAASSDYCRDQSWQWDGVQFRFFNSVKTYALASSRPGNNSSCVLMVRSGDQSLLIPGDIERDVERRLVDYYGEALSSTVLIAPHHGSKTSSSWPWVKTVVPDYVVVTSGYRNRFHHPSAAVVTRYELLGASVYRSDRDGAVEFTLTGRNSDAIDILPHRTQKWRYWL